MNVTENVRSARLVKVVRASVLISDLPRSVEKDLTDAARAVRLLIEADQSRAAAHALNVLDKLTTEALPDGPVADSVAWCIDNLRTVLP